MEFLVGDEIRQRAVRMIEGGGPVRLAVAYWGAGAREMLSLKRRRDVKIVCDLTEGRSDPDEIRPMRKKVRLNKRLHAKVYLIGDAVIVCSANASSNGLGTEGKEAKGLIEAGIHTRDPAIVRKTRTWFEKLYRDSRRVSDKDLETARLARANRKPIGKTSKRPGLLDALRTNPDALKGQRVFIVFSYQGASDEAKRAHREEARAAKEAQGRSKLGLDVRDCIYYENLGALPQNAWLIDCEQDTGEVTLFRSQQNVRRYFEYDDGSGRGFIVHVLMAKAVPASERPFRLTARDKKRIKRVRKKLMRSRKTKGPTGERSIALADAAKTLLGR